MPPIDRRVLALTQDVRIGKIAVSECLDKISNGLAEFLHRDLADHALNDLWGFSRADVVPQVVLTHFSALSGVDYSTLRAPSGVIHTYGYLLTSEQGPPGRSKRFRWTSGEIAAFFNEEATTFWSKSDTFLQSVTNVLLPLVGVSPPAALKITATQTISEVAKFEESCSINRWRSRWQVFQNEFSVERERTLPIQAHLLVYQVGSLDGALKLSTVFPVRRERIEELKRQHQDGPTLRFNACAP